VDAAAVLDIALQGLMVSAKLAAPILITSLVVGFAISLVQSITKIQEVTVGIALIICGQWMISELVSFTTDLFAKIPTLLGG
jgi:flagellar biosynthetic protein FliQ